MKFKKYKLFINLKDLRFNIFVCSFKRNTCDIPFLMSLDTYIMGEVMLYPWMNEMHLNNESSIS